MKKPTKTNVNATGKKVTLDVKQMESLVGGREMGSRAALGRR